MTASQLSPTMNVIPENGSLQINLQLGLLVTQTQKLGVEVLHHPIHLSHNLFTTVRQPVSIKHAEQYSGNLAR